MKRITSKKLNRFFEKGDVLLFNENDFSSVENYQEVIQKCLNKVGLNADNLGGIDAETLLIQFSVGHNSYSFFVNKTQMIDCNPLLKELNKVLKDNNIDGCFLSFLTESNEIVLCYTQDNSVTKKLFDQNKSSVSLPKNEFNAKRIIFLIFGFVLLFLQVFMEYFVDSLSFTTGAISAVLRIVGVVLIVKNI